ncbi:MAG: HEPN domain-containing protein, partial [Candidatus Magnetoovum sp. WYHC-5]|nr:HEPN domain-containing protein [Candidatus Magnetoovum sp. WYHC-5]
MTEKNNLRDDKSASLAGNYLTRNRAIALKWLKQAEHDLLMAERNLAIEGYDVTAFLSQQAIEKILKSIFILNGKKVSKNHYLGELASELNLPEKIVD